MTITMTLGEILNSLSGCDWEFFCREEGWNEYCCNEGGDHIDVTLTKDKAVKYGLLKELEK